ncbi:MAG: TetR/AcrR family transcriptional regulator [Bdellovibrionota bacterium]
MREAAVVARHPTQDRILDEAERLFAHHGFAGASLQELAERVGLSKSSLFHHFPTKIELYAAVLERLFEHLWISIESRVDRQAGPWTRVGQTIDLLIDFLAERPTTAKLLLRSMIERDFEDAGLTPEELRERHGQYLARIIQFFIQALQDGTNAGVFRPQHIGHFIQSVVGATLFHFASGNFGEEMIDGDLYAPKNVAARKEEVKNFIRLGLEERK